MLAFLSAFLVQAELFEFCKSIPSEAYLRETIFITLVLATLFVQRTLGSEVLRESLGKIFFIGSLIYISTGMPSVIFQGILTLVEEHLYLLEAYHRSHIIVIVPILFFTWIPWAFVYSILRNTREAPAVIFVISTILAALFSGFDLTPKNWLFGTAIILVGLLLVFSKKDRTITSKGRIQPINKEIWILVLIVMIILPAGPQELVLGSCLAVFLIFLEAKPRIFWWIKGYEQIFDWAFFHSFLLSSFFLLYPGLTMSSLVVGSMMVCLIVPSVPSRKAPSGLVNLILFILLICSLLDLSTSNQRIVLWHFLLSLRLFYFYGKRGAWVAICLVCFVLYYTVTRIPVSGLNLEQFHLDKPRLIEFQNLQRVQSNGVILYSKVDFQSLFEEFSMGKSWIFINSLGQVGDSDTVRIFDVERSKESAKLEPTFYFTDLKGVISRRKLTHLLRENAPNFIAFNFHKIHHGTEYGEWIRILADKLSGGFLHFSDNEYSSNAIKRLLVPFLNVFPNAKVIFHHSGATFYSGLKPRFTFESFFRHPVDFSLDQFLHHLSSRDSIDFLKFKEQLAFLQVDSSLKERLAVSPDNLTLENLSLYFYHHRMDWVAHRLVRYMREWDSLGEGLVYFQNLLENPNFSKASPDYRSFLSNELWANEKESSYLYKIFQEQVIRAFPGLDLVNPSSRINPQDPNLWYQMALLLHARKFKEAHQFMVEKALIPKTSDEKRMIRILWEELELPEAASFYY